MIKGVMMKNTFKATLSTVLLGLACAGSAGTLVSVDDEVRAALSAADATPSDALVTSLSFPPQQARWVRLVILSTHGGAACVDELEVYGPEDTNNLALASRGAAAFASSVIKGYAIHAVANLNDGKTGNDHSWIPASTNEEWAEIRLPDPAQVSRVAFSRDRTGKFTDRQARHVEVRLSSDGAAWTTVAQSSPPARSRPALTLPASALREPTWRGIVDYAFLCERDTWRRMDAKDELSPLLHDRPATPGGAPYWSALARLTAVERTLKQFDDLIARLAAQGLDVSGERRELAALRERAQAEGDSDALYLAARHAKRQLFFRDPRLAPAANVLFTKRHPLHPSHNYSEHMDGQPVSGGGICVLHVPRDADGRLDPAHAEVETLFDGSAGVARHPVADFDGQTVFFAYRQIGRAHV